MGCFLMVLGVVLIAAGLSLYGASVICAIAGVASIVKAFSDSNGWFIALGIILLILALTLFGAAVVCIVAGIICIVAALND